MKSALRSGMRRLAAGICIVSTQDGGKSHAMTVSSVTSVSDEPASLLVCINKETSMQPLFKYGQQFVINILSRSQQDVSNLCASSSFGEERFVLGNWQKNDQGISYLADAQVNFFCRVDNDNYTYGTHQIVIGRLEEATISDAVIDPLVYLDGNYYSVNKL